MSNFSREIIRTPRAISYWRLGDVEGSGVAEDQLISNPLVVTSGVSFGKPGMLTNDSGTAALLSSPVVGTSTSTGIDFTGNSPFSIEAIFVPTNLDSTPRRIVSKSIIDPETSGLTGYDLYATSASISLGRYGSVESVATATYSFVAGVMYYVVATYDGKYVRFYVNGSVISAPIASAASVRSTVYRPSTAPFQLGESLGRQNQGRDPRFQTFLLNGWAVLGGATMPFGRLGEGGFPAPDVSMPAEVTTGANLTTRSAFPTQYAQGSTNLRLIGGVTYTISLWQYIFSNTATDFRMQMYIPERGEAAGSAAIWTTTRTWQRKSITITPAATTPYVVRLFQTGAGEAVTYQTGLLIERGNTVNTYFDAETPGAYMVGSGGSSSFGAQMRSSGNPLAALMQEVAVHGAALSAVEVANHWSMIRQIFPDPQRIRQQKRLTMET